MSTQTDNEGSSRAGKEPKLSRKSAATLWRALRKFIIDMSIQTDEEGEPRPSRKSITTLWRAVNVWNKKELDARDAASTLFRFFRSDHVADLFLVFLIALAVLLLHLVITIAAADYLGKSEFSGAILTAGFAALPIYGAILAWAYVTAGKRLGVVDLFACEIATVCRVGTIFDVGRKYVEKSKKMDANNAIDTPSAHSTNFVSKEDYFPIFANNSQDLQALEALIVSHITEFYTYMKAARDSLRELAQAETVETEKVTMINIIFTLYLAYESGRKAIEDLVEFQPTRSENMIVILLTELECYPFLCEHFKDDELRFQRLQLREADYEDLVPRLLEDVCEQHEGNEKYWAPAQRMVPELRRRYDRALQKGKAAKAANRRRKVAREEKLAALQPSQIHIQRNGSNPVAGGHAPSAT
jgi:hypothetical protein